MGLVPVLAAVVVVGLVILGLITSVRFYQWVLGASSRLAWSFEYFIKGVATGVVLGVIAAPFYLFTLLDAGTRTMVYRGAGAFVIGYAAFVVLGYVGEQAWTRIADHHEAATGHRPLENVLAGESDD